ncbi:conjugal transfer pilus assembly protein TraL [Serratia odorifera]|jgi:conjugal transfer pilus assembly protein TraL|uniref:Protein TraL n=1 Tax=Serratia odorifera TaxID=618 RepID=A0A3S4DBN9_SEROD|nr:MULTISPECIES: type IV conjugative transfer system protein TraL [Serratia]PNK88302.1 type IV conjugative transfer system protein TraL [Serratia odorifera]RII73964.1 type IV conjugative transfer system protein TraL [Serratia odorifera]ULG15704.1 conjugal transfer protein TraL [Serratia proteamaculans]VDZ51180.1 conjugal transfer pilus assembly protein TraL [Serratia odorifera]
MSGDDINTYRFPKTLNNQGRWFGLTPDELIPIVLSACWFFWQGKQIAGIIVAALVYMAIRKIKKGKGSVWLRDLGYWYLPTFMLRDLYKKVPPSCFRQWIK